MLTCDGWPCGGQANALKKKELELQAREAQLERSLKELQRQREQVAQARTHRPTAGQISRPTGRRGTRCARQERRVP
jgi:hypothetical protein